eukprot:21300_1
MHLFVDDFEQFNGMFLILSCHHRRFRRLCLLLTRHANSASCAMRCCRWEGRGMITGSHVQHNCLYLPLQFICVHFLKHPDNRSNLCRFCCPDTCNVRCCICLFRGLMVSITLQHNAFGQVFLS